MTRKRKIILFIVVLLVLLLGAFLAWERVKAPTNEPAATTTPTPTPTPTPSATPTTGTIYGQADTTSLHINKIIILDSTGKNTITTASLDANRNYSINIAPGTYMIDYQAAPDLYPHSPEKVEVRAGARHEVDYMIDNN